MQELISVVVPVYKVEKYLKRCIESIIKQTYKNIEIILVDDGSPDNCGKICDEYASKDKRIKVIHKKNGGLSSARNEGLKIANGEYISFIDSDDYISNVFIEKLYSICKEQKCEIALCEYERVYDKIEHNCIEENKNENSIIEIYNNKEILKKIYSKDYLITIVAWNKLYNKKLFKNIVFPEGRLHEDEATTYKILYNTKKVAILREKLYYYFYDINSIMNKKYNLKRLDILYALKDRADFFESIKEIELYELTMKKYTEALINCYILCKRNIDDSKYIQDILLNNFKKNIMNLIKYKNVKIKSKLKIIFAYICPNLYGKIFLKSKNMGENYECNKKNK